MTVVELTAVRSVCRSRDNGVDALDHVVAAISELLDTSRLGTVQDAAARGYARLVERILLSTHGQEPLSLDNTKGVQEIQRALLLAASNGHLDTVQILLKWCPTANVAHAMEDATAHGHLHVLQWLHHNAHNARTHRMTLDDMDSAAVNGHLDVLQWLHSNRQEGCTTRAMDGAARAGRLEIVQWLHTHRHEGCTTQAMDGAAANGHLAVLSWLHEHRREGCSSLALSVAAQKGHAEVVAWLERVERENSKPLVTWHERLKTDKQV